MDEKQQKMLMLTLIIIIIIILIALLLYFIIPTIKTPETTTEKTSSTTTDGMTNDNNLITETDYDTYVAGPTDKPPTTLRIYYIEQLSVLGIWLRYPYSNPSLDNVKMMAKALTNQGHKVRIKDSSTGNIVG